MSHRFFVVRLLLGRVFALGGGGCVQQNPNRSPAGAAAGSNANVFRPAAHPAPIVIDPTRIPGTYGLLVPVLDAGMMETEQ